MKTQKYVLLSHDTKLASSNKGIKLYRIQALIDFDDVKAGDLGGYIGSYDNLNQQGNCWIYDNAEVYDHALVSDNAKVRNFAVVRGSDTLISGNAVVSRWALVSGLITENAEVTDRVTIFSGSIIKGNARVYQKAIIIKSIIQGNARVYGKAIVSESFVYDNAKVSGRASIDSNVQIYNNARIYGKVKLTRKTHVFENAIVAGNVNIFGPKFIGANLKVTKPFDVVAAYCCDSNVYQFTLGKNYVYSDFFKGNSADFRAKMQNKALNQHHNCPYIVEILDYFNW